MGEESGRSTEDIQHPEHCYRRRNQSKGKRRCLSLLPPGVGNVDAQSVLRCPSEDGDDEDETYLVFNPATSYVQAEEQGITGSPFRKARIARLLAVHGIDSKLCASMAWHNSGRNGLILILPSYTKTGLFFHRFCACSDV